LFSEKLNQDAVMNVKTGNPHILEINLIRSANPNPPPKKYKLE